MDNIRRIPRPRGTTELSYRLSIERTKDNLHKLRAHLIKAYIANNLFYTYTNITHIRVEDKEAMKTQKIKAKKEASTHSKQRNKSNINKKNTKLPKLYKELYVEDIRRIELSDLALALGLTENKLMIRLNKAYEKEGSIMATQQGQINIGNLTRVAGLGLFFKSLDKASNSGLWAEELKAVARLKNYAPGMIMGANTALAQESQALNQAFLMATKLQTLNSNMVPKSSPIGINIQNNLGTQPEAQNGLFLTATMAQKQLEEMGLTKEPLDLNALALTHGIHSGLLPEIEATMDDAQGTASIDIKELGFSSQLDESEEIDDHHEARRAKEMGIVDGLTY